MGQLSVTRTMSRLLLWGCLWGYAWTDSPMGQTAATDISRGRQQVPNAVVNPEVSQDLTALDTAVFAPSPQNATQDTENQEARPQHTNFRDTKSLDKNILDHKSRVTKSLNTNFLDTKSLDTISPDTKSQDTRSLNTKFPDTKSPKTKSLDTKSIDTEPQDTKSLDNKSKNTTSQDAKLQHPKPQNDKLQDDKVQGDKLQHTKPQNEKLPDINIQDDKLQHTKPQNEKLPDINIQDDKLQYTKPQNDKLPDINIQDDKLQDAKAQDTKPQNVTLQDAESQDVKHQDTKPQDAKLHDATYQDAKLRNAKRQHAKHEAAKSQDGKHDELKSEDSTSKDGKPEDAKSGDATSKDDKPEEAKSQIDKPEDSTTPGMMVGIRLTTSDPNVPRDVTPTGAIFNFGAPHMSSEKMKAGEGTLQQGMLTTTSSLMDLLFQKYLASSVQELVDPSSRKRQESEASHQSPTYQIKVTPDTLGLSRSAESGPDKPLDEVTLAGDKQSPEATEARDRRSPVVTEARDKRSPMAEEAREHKTMGATVGEKGKVLRVHSELDNSRSLEEMESQQFSPHRMATDFLNNFKSGSFKYEFDTGTRNKDLRSRENRVEKPDLGFLTGNRAVITYNKSVKRPQKGHREINLIIRIRQIMNDGVFEDMTDLKRFKSPLVKIQNEFKFSADKGRNNDMKGGDMMQGKDGTRGRHVFGRHLMSFLETAKTGSADSKQPLTKGEIEALFAKSGSDDPDETGGSFKTGKETPSSSGVYTFSNRKKAHNNMETSGTDLSEDKKTQTNPEEVTILPSLDNEESQKQLNLPPNLALSPEKDKELDELVDRLQDSYILDFGRKKQSDFKDFEDPDEENDSSEKMIKTPQGNHKLARMFRGRSQAVKMNKRSVEEGSGYYGVSVDDRNDNEVPKEYDVEVDNGVKTERFSRAAKHRRVQRRAATKTTTNAKNESEVTTETYREKQPGKPARDHLEHHEHGSSHEASGKMTKVVGVLLIPFPSSHKQEPAHHVPFQTGHHTNLAGSGGREFHEEHNAGMHHNHPCHYGGHQFGHDDRHPCHHHHHHHHGHHIHMHPHNGRENAEPYPGSGTHHQIHHHSQGETGHAPHHGSGRVGEHGLHQNPFFGAHSTNNKEHQGGHGSKDLEQITVMTHSQHSTRTANGLHVLVILAICFILFTVVLYFIIRSRSGNVRETNSRTALYVPQAKY